MRYTPKELRKTALYIVWRDMLRRARREWNWHLRLGIEEPFMVCRDFQDFDKFAMWARTFGGYVIGRDSQKVVVRKDASKPFDMENSTVADEYIESFGFTPPKPTGCKNGISKRTQHGLSGTRLYEIWKGMRPMWRQSLPNLGSLVSLTGPGALC